MWNGGHCPVRGFLTPLTGWSGSEAGVWVGEAKRAQWQVPGPSQAGKALFLLQVGLATRTREPAMGTKGKARREGHGDSLLEGAAGLSLNSGCVTESTSPLRGSLSRGDRGLVVGQKRDVCGFPSTHRRL